MKYPRLVKSIIVLIIPKVKEKISGRKDRIWVCFCPCCRKDHNMKLFWTGPEDKKPKKLCPICLGKSSGVLDRSFQIRL